jgi:hypothetical protein
MDGWLTPGLLSMWLIVGVPVAFAVTLQTYYRTATAKGEAMPFHSPRGMALWWVVFCVSLASGLGALLFLPMSSASFKLIVAVAYTVAMAVVLVLVAAWLSLKNGDSI